MIFKKAEPGDIPEIMEILKAAQNYLKKEGIDQWQNNYPNLDTISKDIENGNSYLLRNENEIIATAAIIFANDPTYDYIEDGDWLTDVENYGVIHRAAVAENFKGQGIMGNIFNETYSLAVEKNTLSIRIDTHPENKAMQKAIAKENFKYCGIIYTADQSQRLAYEKIIDPKL